jgi:hypothetical protein
VEVNVFVHEKGAGWGRKCLKESEDTCVWSLVLCFFSPPVIQLFGV